MIELTPIKNEQDRDRANFWLQMIVAVAVLILGCATLAALVFLPDRVENSGFNIWLGAAISWFGVLLSFCFPNNIGAAKQQDTLNKLADKTPPFTGEAKDSVNELGSTAAGVSGAVPAGTGSGTNPAPGPARQPGPGEYGPDTRAPGEPPPIRVG